MSQPSAPMPGRQHLSTLYEITRTLNSSLDLDEVLENVMERVIDVTGAERGFLMLCDADRDQLEFKVARGMDRSEIESPEFQVSYTIVRQVARDHVPLLTDNAQYDTRLGGQSIIVLGLRSILCVPMAVKGRLIGLVYVDNRLQTGLFNEDHLALLAAFADQAAAAIENARLYQVAVEKGRMERELQLAYELQRGLMPRDLPTIEGYEIAADWRSAREVAGDFYDCFRFDDCTLAAVIADVSDKGAPAALFMAMTHSLIRGTALSAREPEETLRQVNRVLLNDSESGMFVTVYYSILHCGGEMIGVNAGHNRPLLVHTGRGTHEFLPRGGRPLGWFADLPVRALPIQLEPGDVIVYYTDGLTESENPAGEPFGEDRLVEATRSVADRPAGEILRNITQALVAFMGTAPAFDDTTLMVVRYLGDPA
ncbi:PP2C family protein-serine/threonine phosphatase [Aggregatilinea lenta]|uniref:PP2C family protein-serine/threonine phosphatase n=1 Tax=Aggregatilinea lenta TaxID=913108 RepID=UPI000E5C1113|nr:GAF domain-containing SpoIIE family protein phosphatase [Aggregatilinea lenta]